MLNIINKHKKDKWTEIKTMESINKTGTTKKKDS